MRTEQEMYDLILGVAKADERIRAVYMNGSRTNPNVQKDQYQDYDIVYVVTETESFLSDKNWISVFGERIMFQEPDANDFGWGINTDTHSSYGWLMLFKDGNRIDLGIQTVETVSDEYKGDSLTELLFDKDGILPPIPPANDRGYWISPPTRQKYNGCCNEFWWCLNNVAKGIARDELPYAMEMFNHYVRDMLNQMIQWQIGIDTEFSVSAGKMGKYFKKYLSPNLYEQYAKTYSNSDYDHLWEAVFTACNLFRTIAVAVGNNFDYPYNKQDDENMIIYLNKVKNHEL